MRQKRKKQCQRVLPEKQAEKQERAEKGGLAQKHTQKIKTQETFRSEEKQKPTDKL